MLIWAALGLLTGFAINLIADAWPRREALLPPRCATCSSPRQTAQWLGLVAYLSGRIRCAQCGKPIGWRWPVVELLSIGIFVFLYGLLGPTVQLLIVTLYSAILLLVCVTDFEHRLILDRVMFPSVAAALLLSIVTPHLTVGLAVVGGLIGLLATGIIYLGGKLFVALQQRRGRAIDEVAFGQGDVKLMVFIGVITGTGIVQALISGIVLGGVVAFAIIIYGVLIRQSKLYVPYAYGPYLAIAGWIVLLMQATAHP